jgi:hypothetical protein
MKHYILKSTRKWTKALNSAEFSIRLPVKYVLDEDGEVFLGKFNTTFPLNN